MQKNNLKALVEEIYENLLQRIDENKDASKQEVINYLKEAVDVVSHIDETSIDSIEHAREAYSNTYKELVNQTLTSYEYTNEKFGELTLLQEQTINDCTNNQIDVKTLTDKFSEIQSLMSDEIKKANSVIKELSNKVKILEETSNLDALTKVFNRRALNTYLSSLFSNKGTTFNIHMLMLDLDNFKNINDTHGHLAGDKILIFVSNILRKTLRDGDKVFRYGGEEFVIMLNRKSDEDSEIIANRVLNVISSNKLIYSGNNIYVTASIGLTKIIPGDTPESLLSRADKALYISKDNGKNQVSKVME